MVAGLAMDGKINLGKRYLPYSLPKSKSTVKFNFVQGPFV